MLGYLDPAYFLGGRLALNLEASRTAIRDQVASKLELSIEEAAWAIHQIVNETMAGAARAHILERGKDRHSLPVFAFGGAGPVHGYRIAEALGAPTLMVPLGAGILSTLGFLSAPTAFDFVQAWRVELNSVDWRRADELLAEMTARGRALLHESGIDDDLVRAEYSVDMRYVGQGHEIIVPLLQSGPDSSERGKALESAFRSAYLQLYQRPGPPVRQEILNWRVTVSGPKPRVELLVEGTGAIAPEKGERSAYFPELGGFVQTPVLNRYGLRPGYSFVGPAIVEERESTTVIAPNARCHVDERWNLVVELTRP
jgi:N-methylhydantoinase A